MMNPEIKKEWIEALLSGEYKQGQNKLRTSEGGYCCLGVLCDIAAKHGEGNWVGDVFYAKKRPEIVDYGALCLDYSDTAMPVNVSKWAGLKGKINPMIGKHSLSEYNDGYVKNSGDEVCGATMEPKSFEFIAGLIEAAL